MRTTNINVSFMNDYEIAEFRKGRRLTKVVKDKISRALKGKKKPGLARRVAGTVLGRTAGGRVARLAGAAGALGAIRYGGAGLETMRGYNKLLNEEIQAGVYSKPTKLDRLKQSGGALFLGGRNKLADDIRNLGQDPLLKMDRDFVKKYRKR